MATSAIALGNSLNATSNGAQFKRKATLYVATKGKALDLSDLRFRFHVSAADVSTPNVMSVRVYNLSDATRKQIISEYDSVTLEAGYENANYGIIFSGTIKFFRRGKESNVDSYLEINAADGDLGYNFGFVNQTFAPGASQVQILNANAKAMGATVDPNATSYASTGGVLPRGKVLFGLARSAMDDLAATLNCRWSIQNGVLVLIKETGYLPGQVIVLNSNTGMIGIPEATDNGIEVRSLLNPLAKIGQRIQIDNADITSVSGTQGSPAALGIQLSPTQDPIFYADLAQNDGFYRILVAEHTGDTRGQEWYTDMTCLAIDTTTMLSSPQTSVKAFG